ncbi:hypothetical protein CIHG_10570 [Coccidioides immitis H538.4]|uniref:Uncharacterized protein n=1 Tax=Coccidioides immitis H538.4 TaxID=396776 RepID=A0A0P6Q2Y0_COCIT|nr:hypothetical protein CIHG_10570 [Coccidioides immitis H538.4]
MPVICVASLECLDVAWPPRSNLLSLDEVLYHPRGAVGTLFAGFCGQQNFHGSVEQSLDGLREYIHTPYGVLRGKYARLGDHRAVNENEGRGGYLIQPAGKATFSSLQDQIQFVPRASRGQPPVDPLALTPGHP